MAHLEVWNREAIWKVTFALSVFFFLSVQVCSLSIKIKLTRWQGQLIILRLPLRTTVASKFLFSWPAFVIGSYHIVYGVLLCSPGTVGKTWKWEGNWMGVEEIPTDSPTLPTLAPVLWRVVIYLFGCDGSQLRLERSLLCHVAPARGFFTTEARGKPSKEDS